MAKADLLKWIANRTPPLIAGHCKVAPDATKPLFQTDYNRFNAVTNAAEARAALLSRVPPLPMSDVDVAMAEYNK